MQAKRSPAARLGQFLRECLCWDKAFTRNVFLVALPMVLQSLVESSLHIVDGLMVPVLGDAAYSAVTQANRFTFVFNLFSFGTCSGSAIFMSQYWGARDIKRLRWSMGLAMRFALIIAAVFAAVGMLFPRQVVACFLTPGESFELAVKYLRIVAPGYLFSAINGVYATAIKSAEKTYLPMLAGMGGIVCNTIFNYMMIFGHGPFPAMGVEGAALATTLSACVTMLTNIVRLREASARRGEAVGVVLQGAGLFFPLCENGAAGGVQRRPVGTGHHHVQRVLWPHGRRGGSHHGRVQHHQRSGLGGDFRPDERLCHSGGQDAGQRR